MRKFYGFRTYRVLELALYHSLGKLPEPELNPQILLTNLLTGSRSNPTVGRLASKCIAG